MGVEITGLDALRAKVQLLKDNKPKALRAAGIKLLKLAQQSIQEQGPGWAPFKKLPAHPHQLVWESGELFHSLDPGDSHNILQVDGDTVTTGTNVPYAHYQNDGDSRLPARPFEFIDDAREQAASKAFIAALTEGVQ
jgi:phage gpG-like protein